MRLLTATTPSELTSRGYLLLGVIVYLVAFEWMYREMIAPVWSYLGFTYETPSSLASAIGWMGSLLPVLWIPIKLRRPSQAIYWLLYLTVYIPSLLVPYYLNRQPVSELAVISLYFFAGFAAINVSFRIPLLKSIRVELGPTTFWVTLWVLYLAFTCIFIIGFGSTLRLVSFADRYDLRLATRHVEAGAVAEYARSWLAFCLNPLLLALGLLRRRPLLFMVGFAGAILLYSSSATRVFLVGIVYIPILYFALKGTATRKSFGVRMTSFTCVVFLVSIGLHLTGSPFAAFLWEPFVVRDHVNAGVLTGYYSEFFATNPLTFGSQITGVDLLIDYPYSLPIQFLIGVYLADETELSANAHVWADGIASFGPIGVLILSMLLAGVFYIVDFCCQHLDPEKAALFVAIHYANLSNVALATSVIGGGLGFSILLLALMPQSLLSSPHSGKRRIWSKFKLNLLGDERARSFLKRGAAVHSR